MTVGTTGSAARVSIVQLITSIMVGHEQAVAISMVTSSSTPRVKSMIIMTTKLIRLYPLATPHSIPHNTAFLTGHREERAQVARKSS